MDNFLISIIGLIVFIAVLAFAGWLGEDKDWK